MKVFVACLLFVYTASSWAASFDPSVTGSCTSAGCVQAASDALQLVNLTSDPCVDFYEFACGTFVSNYYVTDTGSHQYGDQDIANMVEKSTNELLAEDIDDTTPVSEQKAIKYYQSCVNAEVNDATSTTFLRGYVEEVGGFKLIKKDDVAANWTVEYILSRSLYDTGTALFELTVEVDSRNTTRNGLILAVETTPVFQNAQVADNLADDDVYLQEVKDAYVKYLKDLMKKLLTPDTYRGMRDHYLKEMVDFEFELAKIVPAPDAADGDQSNNDVKWNDHTETEENKFSVPLSKLQSVAPGFDWSLFFKSLAQKYKANSLADTDNLFISYRGQTYFQKLAQLLNNTINGPNKLSGRRAVHNYIAFRNIAFYLNDMACSYSNRLASVVNMANGQGNADLDSDCSDSNRKPSDCVAETKKVYMQVLARRFLTNYFPQSYVDNVTAMSMAIRDSFIAELQQLTWMDDQTKASALLKIRKMVFSVGYPPNLFQPSFEKQYERLAVFEGDFLTSRESAKHYMKGNELRSLDEPSNRVDCSWQGADPVEQNAYYSPLCNAFVILAGIAVPPNYRLDFPSAYNWGRSAPIIGHEMTHGFDNNGAKYNDVGLFANWWTDQSLNVFQQRYSCLVDQFNAIAANSTIYGYQVLGEAIADNGGLKIGYNAYRKYFGDAFMSQVTVPGLPFNNEQMFFLSISQQFCYAFGEEGKASLMADEHPFPPFRVNGMMANFEPWAKAFNCPLGSPMNPAGRTRCDVW